MNQTRLAAALLTIFIAAVILPITIIQPACAAPQVGSPENAYDCAGVDFGTLKDLGCGCGKPPNQGCGCGKPAPVCGKCDYTMTACEKQFGCGTTANLGCGCGKGTSCYGCDGVPNSGKTDSGCGCGSTMKKDTKGVCCATSQMLCGECPAGRTNWTKDSYGACCDASQIVCGRCFGSKPAVPKIVCRKLDFRPPVHPAYKFVAHYDLNHTASECGGSLPTSDYFGFLVNEEICGADTNWSVRSSPPGVGVDYWGACPYPANPSIIDTIWISKYVGCPGSAPASSGAMVISKIIGETPSITCRKTNFNPLQSGGSNVRPITLSFSGPECSGGLPDSSFIGLISNRSICGISESWTQPTSGQVSFWYKGGCSNSSTGSYIEVLYIKR